MALMTFPYSRLVDANGAALSGGKVYFYAAGSSTPLATYSEPTNTTPNTNPVIADANGIVGPIYMANASYKITIKTSADASSIYPTIDNFAGGLTTDVGQIQGTATNDGAAAGKVGEVISSTIGLGSATSLTTTVSKNITTISLTAGDWDVWGSVVAIVAAGTISRVRASIGPGPTGTLETAPGGGSVIDLPYTATANTNVATPVGKIRASLAATTTYYLVANVTGTGTLTGAGTLFARRAR